MNRAGASDHSIVPKLTYEQQCKLGWRFVSCLISLYERMNQHPVSCLWCHVHVSCLLHPLRITLHLHYTWSVPKTLTHSGTPVIVVGVCVHLHILFRPLIPLLIDQEYPVDETTVPVDSVSQWLGTGTLRSVRGVGHRGVSGEWDICLHSYRKQTGKPFFDWRVIRAIVTDNRRDLHRWLKLVHYINPVVHYLYPLVDYSVVCYFYPVVDYPVVCYFYRVVHYFYQQASLCVCVALSTGP